MMNEYDKLGSSIVGVQNVEFDKLNKYGIKTVIRIYFVILLAWEKALLESKVLPWRYKLYKKNCYSFYLLNFSVLVVLNSVRNFAF